MTEAGLAALRRRVISCRRCPRLVSYREGVVPRASFRGERYWGKPLPGFGDPAAWLVLLGLAPAAHGGNRTGRVFTGDESGRFLTGCLHAVGMANKATSTSRRDGLKLIGCYTTAAVRCAPPENRPTKDEFDNCSPYFEEELELLPSVRAVLALGGLAFRSYLSLAERRGEDVEGLKFSHGARCPFTKLPTLYGSYHPSPQNTYTGRLTQGMLVGLIKRMKAETLC